MRSGGQIREILGRALDRFRRVAGTHRVLQIEELDQAVTEHVSAHALRGLQRRYLPSRISLRVSQEDLRSLRPFEQRIHDQLRAVIGRMAEQSNWMPTVDRVEIVVQGDTSLRSGSPPFVTIDYPPAKLEPVRWSPVPSVGRGSSRDTEPVGTTSPRNVRLVITGCVENGTAIQEEVWLHLGRNRPGGALGDDPSIGGTNRTDGSDDLFGTSGSVRKAAPSPDVMLDLLPVGWDRPWAEVYAVTGGARHIWCSGRVAFLGRDPGAAHVVPSVESNVLSRCHLAMWADDAGGITVCDLGSTNGTWLDGERLPSGVATRLPTPCRLSIGSRSRLEVHVE
jgi:hypothetical protein